MAIPRYGVWKGLPVAWDGRTKPDHGHLTFTAGTSELLDAAVNIMSQSADSRLVCWLIRDLDSQRTMTRGLKKLPLGFQSISSDTDMTGLDYLRDHLFPVKNGVLVSHKTERPDILGYLDPILNHAISEKAHVYLYGQKYDGKDGTNGTHDIHMNQGNAGQWAAENGTHQDGGIIMEFPDGHWEGIFLAFAVQASKTDEKGNPAGPTFAEVLGAKTASPDATDYTLVGLTVQVHAVLFGAAERNDGSVFRYPETVYLLNRCANDMPLEGWSLKGKSGQGCRFPPGEKLDAHSTKTYPAYCCMLSDQGGSFHLTNHAGGPVHNAHYTKEMIKREGELVMLK